MAFPHREQRCGKLCCNSDSPVIVVPNKLDAGGFSAPMQGDSLLHGFQARDLTSAIDMATTTSQSMGYPSLPDVTTLQALLQQMADHGSHEALVAFHKDSAETWSYEKLFLTCRKLATGLQEAGLTGQTPVAIYSPNRVEWLVVCLALLDIGTVPVPIDSQLGSDELAYVLEDSAAQWVITTRSLADRMASRKPSSGDRVILLDAAENDPQSWKRFLHEPTREGPPVRPDDTALLFYTSGVSGKPKGVPLSHVNLLSNLKGLVAVSVYRTEERLLLPLPLHHVYPFVVGLLAPLALGLTVVLPHSLTGPQMRRALQDGRVTALIGVPRLFNGFYEGIERQVRQKSRMMLTLFHGLLACSTIAMRRLRLPIGRTIFAPLRRQFASSLRTMVYGGAPLDPELAWKLTGLGWQIGGGYGLTETSPILTVVTPGSRRLDTSGRALPGVVIRIADPDPDTGQGEIQAQGPNIFSGYLHLQNKTSEAFTEDGWFRTGDLGYLDEEDELHIVGRASSRITLPGGEKIWPERIEEILDALPSIRESGVLAHGGRVVALVVPASGTTHSSEVDRLAQSIRSEVKDAFRAVPSYSRPGEIVFSFNPLPRTRLGKIQRHKLKQLFETEKQRGDRLPEDAKPIAIEDMGPEDRLLLEDSIALRTWTWLAERFPAVRLTPDSNMSLELGLDSLEWMTLTLELHDSVSVDLSEEAVARIVTVRDLLREAVEAEQVGGGGESPATQLTKPDTLLDEGQRQWLAERTPTSRGLGSILFAVDRLLMQTYFSLEVHGIDRLPREGPCVLAPNHVSLLDAPALMASLPSDRLHRINWGGWTGIMFRNPVMRLVSRAARVLPIDQRSRPLANLALGAAALARGDSVVWFPEGDRSRNGKLQPFQPGIGLILTAHPVPVVPILIEGTFDALPRGAFWPRKRRIRVSFGEALNPDELAGDAKGSDRFRQIAKKLHDHVARLAEKGAA